MKRHELIKIFEKIWSVFVKGGKETYNFSKRFLKTEIPRHNEIVDELAIKICKDLDILFRR